MLRIPESSVGRRAAGNAGQHHGDGARLLNEARAVNIVQHPSLVNIFEFGRMDDGTAYIIMEYLEGETLRHRMARGGGRLGADAIRIARQIASALAAAHAKRIVHRDLKPADMRRVASSPEGVRRASTTVAASCGRRKKSESRRPTKTAGRGGPGRGCWASCR